MEGRKIVYAIVDDSSEDLDVLCLKKLNGKNCLYFKSWYEGISVSELFMFWSADIGSFVPFLQSSHDLIETVAVLGLIPKLATLQVEVDMDENKIIML